MENIENEIKKQKRKQKKKQQTESIAMDWVIAHRMLLTKECGFAWTMFCFCCLCCVVTYPYLLFHWPPLAKLFEFHLFYYTLAMLSSRDRVSIRPVAQISHWIRDRLFDYPSYHNPADVIAGGSGSVAGVCAGSNSRIIVMCCTCSSCCQVRFGNGWLIDL